MSRREWRCRNPACPVPHGAVLGRLTGDGGLVLDPAVTEFRCYLDTRRAAVACPACGVMREFRGGAVIAPGNVAGAADPRAGEAVRDRTGGRPVPPRRDAPCDD